MRLKVIFVYTHDSIGLGEDGPTHQPIEHIPSLRLIPNLSLWRPCDSAESAVAWASAIEYDGPTCLLFSRQTLQHQKRNAQNLADIARGGYVLLDCVDQPEVIFISTGSEVELAVAASHELTARGKKVRVVSMPSTDVFLAQDMAYQSQVLPHDIKAKIVIEAAATEGWYKFVGCHGKVIGIDRFGASAPAKEVYKECGLTVEHIVNVANELLENLGE